MLMRFSRSRSCGRWAAGAALVTMCIALAGCADSSVAGAAPTATASPSDVASPPASADATQVPNPASSTSTTSTSSSAVPTSATRSHGCPATSKTGAVPRGADVVGIEDVDGDGKTDTAYWSQDGTKFFVHTASGATVPMSQLGLDNNRSHSGWVARMAHGPVLAVVSDGRTATLHAFVNCRIVTTTSQGTPYHFSIGSGAYGTGQECTGTNAATRAIMGVAALKQKNGSIKVKRTAVTVSSDGRTATNGAPHVTNTQYKAGTEEYVSSTQATCQPLHLAQTSN